MIFSFPLPLLNVLRECEINIERSVENTAVGKNYITFGGKVFYTGGNVTELHQINTGLTVFHIVFNIVWKTVIMTNSIFYFTDFRTKVNYS